MAGLTRKRPARDGRTDKVPSHPQYGFKLNAHDREHHLTFEQALYAYQSGKFSGIGIVLTDRIRSVRLSTEAPVARCKLRMMPQQPPSKSEGTLHRSRSAAALQARRLADNPKFWQVFPRQRQD